MLEMTSNLECHTNHEIWHENLGKWPQLPEPVFYQLPDPSFSCLAGALHISEQTRHLLGL